MAVLLKSNQEGYDWTCALPDHYLNTKRIHRGRVPPPRTATTAGHPQGKL